MILAFSNALQLFHHWSKRLLNIVELLEDVLILAPRASDRVDPVGWSRFLFRSVSATRSSTRSLPFTSSYLLSNTFFDSSFDFAVYRFCIRGGVGARIEKCLLHQAVQVLILQNVHHHLAISEMRDSCPFHVFVLQHDPFATPSSLSAGSPC